MSNFNISVFDLHCDTVYECMTKKCDFINTNLHISYDKLNNISPYIQCFAICVPEEIRGDKATKMFCDAYSKLKEQCSKYDIKLIKNYDDVLSVIKNKGKGAIFTVENATVLAGRLDNINLLKDSHVKFVSLTWNGRNELGAGASVSHSNGLTRFGRDVVRNLESNNILLDLSHASDRLFYDVINISKKPVVATHSNSRSITNVKRNLTDKQFRIIVKKRGLVGLNFHKHFLNTIPEKSDKYDILRHTEHFLSLGGENTLSLGCDFDGCELPDDVNGIESLAEIFELFLKENYNESLVKKIFFENSLKFCENFDK